MLITITAPGGDVLEWDGQQVDPEIAHLWNMCAPKQWSAMHRRLGVRLARLGLKPNLLGYVWAFQKRGVLHLHLALGAATVEEAYAAQVYGKLLKGDRRTSPRVRAFALSGPTSLECGWAKEWGFGFVDVKAMTHGSKGLAKYLAKYVCKEGASGRSELAETVAHPDVPARPIYIARGLTATTRCTMKNLRLRRYYWRAITFKGQMLECWYVEDLAARGMKVYGGRLCKPLSAPREVP